MNGLRRLRRCPAVSSRRRCDARVASGQTIVGATLVRQPSAYGFGRASYELNLECNNNCEHCYLGLKRYSLLAAKHHPLSLPARTHAAAHCLGRPARGNPHRDSGADRPDRASVCCVGGNELRARHSAAQPRRASVRQGHPHRPPSVVAQRREATINLHVRTVAPALRWHLDVAGWKVLGFEYIEGRHPDYSPGSADLPIVVDVLQALGAIPCPEVPVKDAGQRWASYLDRPAAVELFAGNTLLHTGLQPGEPPHHPRRDGAPDRLGMADLRRRVDRSLLPAPPLDRRRAHRPPGRDLGTAHPHLTRLRSPVPASGRRSPTTIHNHGISAWRGQRANGLMPACHQWAPEEYTPPDPPIPRDRNHLETFMLPVGRKG